MRARENAIAIYSAAVKAVQPEHLVPEYVRVSGNMLYLCGQEVELHKDSKIFVIGGGKAAAAMAKAVESILGSRITAGIVLTKYHHSLPLDHIRCLEAGHPVPDEQGVSGTSEMVRLVQQAGTNDIVICLISGGASALLVDLPGGISLADLRIVFQLLLGCGASIDEINTVRKHLSGIKGGQLVRNAPAAKWFSLVISDVPGDDLSVIASGPTVPDLSSFAGVGIILDRYRLWPLLPGSVAEYLQGGINGSIAETPKPGDPIFNNVFNAIIGTNKLALEAAAGKARELGYPEIVIQDDLAGDAATVGKKSIMEYDGYKGDLPVCFLSGGETTVVISGQGKGGRNQHLALSALISMPVNTNITLLAAGTDGTDGPTDAAGAIIDAGSMTAAKQMGLDPKVYFNNQDAYHFFEKIGGLLKTGATQTNVMDLLIAIVE